MNTSAAALQQPVPATMTRVDFSTYLALEARSTDRLEYYDGQVVAMAGGTHTHARIAANLMRELGVRLKGKPCEPYGSDLKIQIPGENYVYPDALVACPPFQFADARETILVNPRIVFEVLSDSTALHDHTRKLALYARVPSLETCVLVSHQRPHVLTYTFHQGQSHPVFTSDFHEGLDAILPLPGLKLELPLAEIYMGMDFPQEA